MAQGAGGRVIMKIVLAKAEVAEALQMTVEEFDSLLPSLFASGFPRPVQGIGERWSITDVMLWVNRASIEQTIKNDGEVAGFAEGKPRRSLN